MKGTMMDLKHTAVWRMANARYEHKRKHGFWRGPSLSDFSDKRQELECNKQILALNELACYFEEDEDHMTRSQILNTIDEYQAVIDDQASVT